MNAYPVRGKTKRPKYVPNIAYEMNYYLLRFIKNYQRNIKYELQTTFENYYIH